mmetsp:Transcript_20209/g.51557  ORF Transcript_20209/g.51557 Transcript_20209/m.51557 type:complete len:320 (+) Transcript_20209:1087-2046(+)
MTPVSTYVASSPARAMVRPSRSCCARSASANSSSNFRSRTSSPPAPEKPPPPSTMSSEAGRLSSSSPLWCDGPPSTVASAAPLPPPRKGRPSASTNESSSVCTKGPVYRCGAPSQMPVFEVSLWHAAVMESCTKASGCISRKLRAAHASLAAQAKGMAATTGGFDPDSGLAASACSCLGCLRMRCTPFSSGNTAMFSRRKTFMSEASLRTFSPKDFESPSHMSCGTNSSEVETPSVTSLTMSSSGSSEGSVLIRACTAATTGSTGASPSSPSAAGGAEADSLDPLRCSCGAPSVSGSGSPKCPTMATASGDDSSNDARP